MKPYTDPRVDLISIGDLAPAYLDTYESVRPYLGEGRESQFSPVEVALAAGFRQAGISGYVQQAPVGRFRTDFYFSKFALAVEVDGDAFHDREKDAERDLLLRDLGVKLILHFRACQVMADLGGCIGKVREAFILLERSDPSTTRIAPRPLYRRMLRRMSGEETGCPSEDEIRDVIRVLEEGPPILGNPDGLYLEAERLMFDHGT